uniref:Pentatricopeptide repeat-containing protein n=1 Tax=Chenopodium quinoa TaxID=63459 RepID=A0A803KPQ3_CHEQI
MSSTSKLIYTLLHRKPKSFNQLKQIHAILITTNLKSPSTLAKLIENHFSLSPNKAPIHAHLIVNNNQTDYQLFLLNTLIKCSLPRDSIHLFAKWVSVSSIVFDDYTFIFALGACARSPFVSGLYEGKQIHARAMKLGFMPDLLVSTTALHFYANNGGYSSQKQNSHENSIKALVSFKEMMVADDSDVKPNGMTMVCVLSTVSQLGSLESGCSVHGYIAKTIDAPENDVYVGTSLVDMYSKCGCLGIASKVFAMMNERNVRTWTAMVTGLAFYGKGKEAIELLNEMREYDVRPNTITFTSTLSACCHAGLVEEALYLFHNMEKEFGVTPQIEHYGCIVDLLGKSGLLREAYEFIVRMPTESNSVLWRSLLGSCRLHGDFVMGERVGKILLQLQLDLHLGNEISTSKDYIGLSNVYALAERWEDVGTIREEMRMKGLEIKPGHSAVH